MPFKIGIVEVALILLVIFIIFGAGRLPQLFEMVGKGVRAISGKKKEGGSGGEKEKGKSAKS
ncbi:twin-arginine translocase TatA/TatE family subunit [Chloroflexota bacterium]